MKKVQSKPKLVDEKNHHLQVEVSLKHMQYLLIILFFENAY